MEKNNPRYRGHDGGEAALAKSGARRFNPMKPNSRHMKFLTFPGRTVLFAGWTLAVLGFAGTVWGASPGGVATNLHAWYRADAGVTKNAGNSVTAWADQTGNYNSTGVVSAPFWNAQTMNFNPAVDFDGASYLNLPNSALTSGTGSYTGFLSFFTNTGAWNPVVSGGTESNNQRIYFGCGGNSDQVDAWYGTANDLHSANNVLTLGLPSVGTFYYNSASGREIFNNGASVGTSGATTRNTGTNNHRIGTRPNLSEIFNGRVSEIIIYSRALSTAEMQRVESYLGLKYGETLTHDYLDSTGTVFCSQSGTYSAYNNDLTGIGRDDTSGLAQIKSKSVNTSSLVTLEAVGEGSNGAPTWVDITDREFLCSGDDGGLVTSWTSTGAPTGAVRLSRTWRVREVGNVGLVNISVNDADLPTVVGSGPVLYTDTNADFTSGSAATAMTLAGGVWTAQLSLSNGNYFTIGCPVSTPTFTPTLTVTVTPSVTPSVTATPSFTATPSATPSATESFTATFTPTVTATPTSSPTVTVTPSATESATFTQTPSFTATTTATPTATESATFTETPSFTATATVTPTSTQTQTATPTFTATVTPSVTSTASVTPTLTQSATATATPSITRTSTHTPVYTPTVTPTVTVTPTITRTATITKTATITPTLTITPTSTLSPTITRSATATPSGTITPTRTITSTVVPYTNLGAVVVYPNPYRAKEKSVAEVKFGHLPPRVTVRLYELTGGLVCNLEKNNPQSVLVWNLTNTQGSPVASGIYIYILQDGQGGEVRGKVAIIR
jgi:hypothetical protein